MTQISDWLEVCFQRMKPLVEWSFVLGGSGAQCVMIFGTIEMLLLSVDNLDSVQ